MHAPEQSVEPDIFRTMSTQEHDSRNSSKSEQKHERGPEEHAGSGKQQTEEGEVADDDLEAVVGGWNERHNDRPSTQEDWVW